MSSSSPTAAYSSLDSVERGSSHNPVEPDDGIVAEAPSSSTEQGRDDKSNQEHDALTRQEIVLLRELLLQNHSAELQHTALQSPNSARQQPPEPIPDELPPNPSSMSSVYNEFPETTHAWAIFADEKGNSASFLDRLVGVMIICFQIFTYSLFAREAIDDYQRGVVSLTVSHDRCVDGDGYISRSNGNRNNNGGADDDSNKSFQCEAGFTNNWDALVAFFMLGIFLAADFCQAGRAIRDAPTRQGLAFALTAGLEVTCAFFAACVAVSYNLYIGEVTDAVEVGVGLLFIRELSARAYEGIRQKNNVMQKKQKHYKTFFGVLSVLVVIGFLMDPLCEFLFAASKHY